jgi:alkaline phosphatase D
LNPGLDDEIRRALPVTRRRFLSVTGAAAALAFSINLPDPDTGAAPERVIRSNPFTLGIASGDPLPDSVVLWTRLAPVPFDPMGGLDRRSIPVRWQVARDERFRDIVRAGTATARPEYRHSVHVDVRGLAPGRHYYYRFRVGDYDSPVGRTRTAPDPRGRLGQLRFAFASCQNYPEGFYTAYRHMAGEDLDVVFFLGDYIYENAVNETAGVRDSATPIPDVFTLGPDTLDLYRLRYSLYKSDPDLQAAHAAFPWIVTWDDHEVQDNYAGDISRNNDPVGDFIVQRANAYRAYWEHQPLRALQEPEGPDAVLYRRFGFGDLLQVSMLDTRQYRSDQACGDGAKADCLAATDPARTITGDVQEKWLLDGMAASRARWNLIAQQVMMAQRKVALTSPAPVSMDAWDGYQASRRRILDGLVERQVPGVVVITGDTHTNYADDLKQDFDDQASATVGVEFVGTSISSGGNGMDTNADRAVDLAANPHIKFANEQRGYVTCALDRDQLRADFKVLPYISTPDAPISVRASFTSLRTRPGLQTA